MRTEGREYFRVDFTNSSLRNLPKAIGHMAISGTTADEVCCSAKCSVAY